MVRKKKVKDPFFEREATKYENPIPSREFILDFLKKRGKPQTMDEIIEALQLFNDEQKEAIETIRNNLADKVHNENF